MNSGMNTEAALQLFPLPSNKNQDPEDPEYGDGDGGSHSGFVDAMHIDVAENGYCVTIHYVDMPPERYVVKDFEEVIKVLRGDYTP